MGSGSGEQGRFWGLFLCLALAVVWLLPLLVFAGCLLVEGYGVADTLAAVVAQYGSERRNLFMVGVPALAPMLLLAMILAVYRRRRGGSHSYLLLLGGVLPVILVLFYANLGFWPLFLPGRDYPGWPHGLEMLIAPLFFAPAGVVLGLLITGLLLRNGR